MSEKIKEIEMELKPYETMCEQTTECLRSLITGGEEADPQMILAVAKTLGEIIDAKKDIVEMCYKKQIIEAMEENADEYGKSWDEEGPMRYYPRPRDSRGRYMQMSGRGRRGYEDDMMPDYRDMDMDMGRMYYDGRVETASGNINRAANTGRNGDTSMREYHDDMMPMRDRREGRSGMRRRTYMESKEMQTGNPNEDKQNKMRKLEDYMNELSSDVKEMIEGSSPEEKNLLRQKIAGLANAI